MSKYLELFRDAFDNSIDAKTKLENKPYIGYSLTDGMVYTVVPKPVIGPADNEIWYTSTDKQVVTPSNTDSFGVSIVSNEYNDGRGVITFDGPVTSIGEFAFGECYSLTSITLPNSIKSIGDAAFNACSSLSSIAIPNSVTNIGGWVFEGCSSLSSITIPNSVTSIGNSNFGGCSSLTSIVVESGNTTYDSRENCNAIIETATNTLIAGCQNTVIPNSVTSIGGSAFNGCSSLTSVTIPNSVTSIGSSAFNGCSSLTSITIPNSVTSIGGGAFNGTGIYNDNSNWENDVLYIDNYLIDAKDSISGTYTIKENTRLIADGAFTRCSSLSSITIPDSVMSIGVSAFASCSSLTSITIGNSVTSIGDYAFYFCRSLTSITIPNSVTSIGNDAFQNCDALTSVTIPNSVTSIGDSAFSYCDALNSIIIGNSVISIGEWAFAKCYRLAYITFEDTVDKWNNINKESNWNKEIPATYVQCSDGQVAL